MPLENELLTAAFDKLDDRGERVRALMEKVSKADLATFWAKLDSSAIYHDRAIEGEVISPDELSAAFDPRMISDISRQALFASLRNHREAFVLVREYVRRKNFSFSLDVFLSLHRLFATREGEDNPEFRTDIPLHRTYFHEISLAAAIDRDMAELLAWMNDRDEQQELHPMAWAARFHHRFMRIFPWSGTSGKIGRAVMHIHLMRNGYLPAVIHATERQRYYESLRCSTTDLMDLLIDSETSAFQAAQRFLGPRQ